MGTRCLFVLEQNEMHFSVVLIFAIIVNGGGKKQKRKERSPHQKLKKMSSQGQKWCRSLNLSDARSFQCKNKLAKYHGKLRNNFEKCGLEAGTDKNMKFINITSVQETRERRETDPGTIIMLDINSNSNKTEPNRVKATKKQLDKPAKVLRKMNRSVSRFIDDFLHNCRKYDKLKRRIIGLTTRFSDK